MQNPTTATAETFTQALNNLVSSDAFISMTEKEQRRAMRAVEDRFYDAGLEVVFAMPEYRDVARAYRDFITIKDVYNEQGKIRR